VISWLTEPRFAEDRDWAVNHLHQVATLMRFLESPLAVTARTDDTHAKDSHLVPKEGYMEEAITVRHYSEGLAGVYWRNFYGPPFVELFGERLKQLPTGTWQAFEGGIVLTQPYALPGDAFTEAGKAREREFIQLLGPECFYDHEKHTLPTRRPHLPASWLPR